MALVKSKVTTPTFVIAIPSYKRAVTLRNKTLAMLYNKGVPASIINVFVASEDEKVIYQDVLIPHTYGKIIVGVPGMRAIRNFITEYFSIGAQIMNIDDDVSDVKELCEDGSITPVKYLMPLFTNCFRITNETGHRLFGFYPVSNGFFMNPRIACKLNYIIGSMWGIINPGIEKLKVTMDDKEDVQRSIIMYILDGGVLRFEQITPVSAYYKEPGGMQVERTKERIHKSAEAIVNSYTGLAKINLRKKSGYSEVRLRDSRADKTYGFDALCKFEVVKVC